MTHRARIAAQLAVLAVILGFVLNALSASSPSSSQKKKAPSEVEESDRPTSPLFVPRPAAMLIGQSLTADSSAEEVAEAFALAYFSYEPGEDDPARFAATLPKLAPAARDDIAGQIKKDAKDYRGKAEDGDTSSVTVANSEKVDSSAGRATVRMVLADQLGRDAEGSDDAARWTMTLKMKSKDDQWLVTSARLV
ncbi:hypothetical protein [Streptomyces sp. PU-14G]|uniref:hypothetical protein n=1 Tax=Streptomyces sp. PU-14G TaxID=2800808 RepID=UPI0034DE8B75